MSKFLYSQDQHCKGVSPARRTDNYFASWMLKFKEMLSIAKKKKVDGLIFGGDLLEVPCVADSIVDSILDEIESTAIPCYIVWGNHNMIGHHRATSNNTSLAHMIRRCKLLKDVKEIVESDFTFTFIEYDHNVEEVLKKDGILYSGGDDRWKVAVVHAFVTPKEFRPDVLHVVADDIRTDYDLVLVAHYHEPWNKKIGNTEFLDIGAFGRCSIAEAKIDPSVLLLDTKKRSYEIIKLKSAKPGNEVFDLTKKENEETTNEELENFISNLKDFKTTSLDLRGIIEQVAKEQKIDRNIVDIIITKIGELECNASK